MDLIGLSSFRLPALAFCWVIANAGIATAADDLLLPQHWFDLETASDVQVAPDGGSVVYVRRFNDIMLDRGFSNLWMVDIDGSNHRPLTTGNYSDGSPRFSHDGSRVAFISDRENRSQIMVLYLAENRLLRVTNTPKSPGNLAWSPDDSQIAFTMPVPTEAPSAVKMPFKPEGAQWADPPVVIDRMTYRFDKRGYLPHAHDHIFVVPSLGGTPRQLTDGDYDHGRPDWSADGQRLFFSATRKPEADWIVEDSEIYSVTTNGQIETLTDRRGPDADPVVSPDGAWLAYTGFDERGLSYAITRLYVMPASGGESRCLTGNLDRDVYDLTWAADSQSVYCTVQDQGAQHAYSVSLSGSMERLTDGQFMLRGLSAAAGKVAAVLTDPWTPSDVVAIGPGKKPVRLTAINDDVIAHRRLGEVEEFWCDSSHDGRKVQGWIVKPPEFDPQKKYPLILYIHGGPHAMYGASFWFEFQAYAASGYVVVYPNPRGSTGYGEEFGNIIQYNYPGDDYFDLMSAVDAAAARGYVDGDNLFVTGGSGGGVLTCWLIGRTDRFAAAVSQYPVINWYSFLLTCDVTTYVAKRWFRQPPWEDFTDYMQRSPIALVGNVTTPTLLITGTDDWRTPISETEQYYQALKLQKKEVRMVRIPDEPHGVRARPSHYVAKMLMIEDWFKSHSRGTESATKGAGD